MTLDVDMKAIVLQISTAAPKYLNNCHDNTIALDIMYLPDCRKMDSKENLIKLLKNQEGIPATSPAKYKLFDIQNMNPKSFKSVYTNLKNHLKKKSRFGD
eukprot:NODE_122_length_17689_cov_1.046219.p13 type:complete len:100 gc:universal NODE_122_length_17689_cov_1.046219:9776-9477(-)